MNSGWMCPGCNRCYSPTTPQCFTCGQPISHSSTTFPSSLLAAKKGNIKAEFTVPTERACNKKDCKVHAGGYCAKCHSEFY